MYNRYPTNERINRNRRYESRYVKVFDDEKPTPVEHNEPKVEEIQNGNSKVAQAKSQDLSYSGTYTVTSNALNIRYTPGDMSRDNVAHIAYRGTTLTNNGYFTKVDGKIWLLVQCGDKTGYVMKDFVKK